MSVLEQVGADKRYFLEEKTYRLANICLIHVNANNIESYYA